MFFFEKTEEHENMFFFERQNSSGGLRPPQQSIVQPLLLVILLKYCLKAKHQFNQNNLYSFILEYRFPAAINYTNSIINNEDLYST